MITEDYVSLEVAQLLKEKGFDESTLYHYLDGNGITTCNIDYKSYRNSKLQNGCNAPTLQMAMKWLRETHNCVINVNYIDFLEHGEVWSYTIINKSTFAEYYKDTENSYKLACEEAIKYCLENLI